MAKRSSFLLLVALFALIYLLPLGVRPMFVPDESRYGEIPREMLASGDWVVPHLNGLRYFEKPVLGYWLNAASIWLFGENNFAIRLPSALAVGGTALLLFFFVRRAADSPNEREDQHGAALAAFVYLVSFEVVGIGTFNVLDSLLAFFLSGCIIFFYQATESPAGSGTEKKFLLLSGLFCGLAFLTKGFLALAVPVLALAPYLLWQRRPRDLFRMPWLPLLAAVMVALPWGVMIHRREPEFWSFFFWNEHVRRFLANDAQHRQTIWFFFLTAPAMFLPWTFMIPATLSGLKKKLDTRAPSANHLRLCLCWLLVPFLFFSVGKGKLLTYILPCFPPFAVLMAAGLREGLSQGRHRAFRIGAYGLAALFGLLAVALISLQLVDFHGFRLYGQEWKWLLMAGGLSITTLFCVAAARNRDILLLGLAPISLFLALPFALPEDTLEFKAPGSLLAKHQQQITPETVIISGEEPVRAVCWFFRRDNVYVLGDSGELDFGLHYADAKGRALDVAGAGRLIAENKGHVVLVGRSSNYQTWKPKLPPPVLEENNGPEGYVLARY